VGAELFYEDGQTGGQDMMLTVVFGDFANKPKNFLIFFFSLFFPFLHFLSCSVISINILTIINTITRPLFVLNGFLYPSGQITN
jgi:hypothetical protein